MTSGDAIREDGEENVSLTRTFYALEKFCESLGKHAIRFVYTIVCHYVILYRIWCTAIFTNSNGEILYHLFQLP